MLPQRVPHPVKDLATAVENGRRICLQRGYCGPFLNGHVYDAFPDPLWHGIGECIHCRNTTSREREERKMALALSGFRQVRRPVVRVRSVPPEAAVTVGGSPEGIS